MQPITTPLTQAATFLVLRVLDKPDAVDKVRAALASTSDLSKNVAVRDQTAAFACTVGIGSDAWDRLTRAAPRPKELHPFVEMRGAKHTAPSTPGDVLLHIRAERRDLCFEFERQMMNALDGAVDVIDDTTGFRYFDGRDLLGFVDGTANPVGSDASNSVFVEADDGDPAATGGSYVVVQKYLHDMRAWRTLPTERQESIVGRQKLDNVELDDAAEPEQKSHKTLASVEGHDILRDNMPFGSPGTDTFGTYFIGYSRRLWVTERMLERMFVGDPTGKHDRILDYSRPLTGSTFFVPSADMLESLGD